MILGKTTLGSKFYAASYYVTKISQNETQVFRTLLKPKSLAEITNKQNIMEGCISP